MASSSNKSTDTVSQLKYYAVAESHRVSQPEQEIALVLYGISQLAKERDWSFALPTLKNYQSRVQQLDSTHSLKHIYNTYLQLASTDLESKNKALAKEQADRIIAAEADYKKLCEQQGSGPKPDGLTWQDFHISHVNLDKCILNKPGYLPTFRCTVREQHYNKMLDPKTSFLQIKALIQRNFCPQVGLERIRILWAHKEMLNTSQLREIDTKDISAFMAVIMPE